MKKAWILKGCVLVIVFFVSLWGFNLYFSAKNEGATEISEGTLPILRIRMGEDLVNTMHGYLGEIDAALLRDAITPIDSSNTLTLEIEEHDYDITAVTYQIYSGASNTLAEEGVLNQLEEKDGSKFQKLILENPLKEGSEYLVCFTIRLDSSRKLHYYGRIKYGTDFHYEECISYVKKLHEMMLQKDDTLNLYLEPDSETISNNLAQVSIHSSFEAVTYAQAKPERESGLSIAIKETNKDYTVVELRWLLSMKNGKGQIQYCDVVENYKVRYGTSRMYLLDYERKQEAVYHPEYLDKANNRIPLGTGLNENVPFVMSDENEKVCFVKNRQLWYYSYQAASVTKVFGFQTEGIENVHDSHNQHNIHILNMNDDGMIEFIVYGYINRGRHEGQNGICVYRFHPETSSINELAFIPTKIPYQNMKDDIEKFTYLNENDIFYFLLDGAMYKVDTQNGTGELVRSGLVRNALTASSDHQVIAIQEKEDSTKNTKITLMDLELQTTTEIECADAYRIQSAGFVLSDFIYGIAKKEDVKIKKSGALLFPMEEIRIVDKDGNAVKTYKKSGKYIIDTEVEGNVITLTYGKKSGSSYKESGSDVIRYKEEDSGKNIMIEYGYDGICYNQLYIAFPPYIYVQTVPAYKAAKEVVTDESRTILVEQEALLVDQYLVYANGELVEKFDTVGEAIVMAEEIRGLVVNNARESIWESNIPSYNQVIGMNLQKVEQEEDTYYACVVMAAALEGNETSVEQLKKKDGNKKEILGEATKKTALNLYGSSLDQTLYYVGKEVPLIARLGGKHYVVIMSYNNTKVRYMDPLLGEEVVKTRSEMERILKSAGNEYYSYVK